MSTYWFYTVAAGSVLFVMAGLLLVFLWPVWFSKDDPPPDGYAATPVPKPADPPPQPRQKPGAWGTVYVFVDREQPNIIKVGYTARLSMIRKREVSRDMAGGAALRQVYAIDMHYARSVERALHQTLPTVLAPCSRGKEWYVLPDSSPAYLDCVVALVERAAVKVRAGALRLHRWPPKADRSAKAWRLTQGGPVRYRPFRPEALALKEQPL